MEGSWHTNKSIETAVRVNERTLKMTIRTV